jgi:apolipoprotein N-acyltransferase
MKTLKLIAAILFSGLCWYLSCDLTGNYWYLLWLAPVPVLLLSFHISAKKAFTISFIAYLIGRLSWLSYLLVVLPLPLAIFSTVLLPLIFAFIVLLTRRIVLIKQNAWSAFAFPVLWCLFEFLVFKFSSDGTAGSIAYTQSNFLQVIQIASVTGILGITFLVTLFPSAIAVAIYHRHNKKLVKPLAVIFSIVVIPLIFGVIRLNNNSYSENAITVGLTVLDEKFHEETNHPNSEKEFSTANMYGDAITRLAQQGAQVVLLPEKALNVTPEFGFPIKSVLANASTSNHITVIAGYTEFINDSLKMNKASVIANGRILADYQKVNLFEGEKRSGFVPGNTNATFELQNISSGVAVCKDLDFQDFMRSYDAKHVQIVYVPAWDFIKDGWLHSRMAILRGVENGYAIVRAARQGELTISDYRGKVLYEATTTNNNAASLIASVPLRATKTIYRQLGDWFGYIIVIAAIYFIIIGVRKNKYNLK